MQNPISQQIDYVRYLSLFWKHKWIVLFPLVIFPLAAGYYSMQLQDSFKSTTLILVQPQKVPTQFVPTTITTGIEERLQTISQQIFSRTRLEQIIREFNLFQKEKESRSPEEIIEVMRSRIDLKVHRKDAFQLSFVDPNPRLAMLVTNKLASLFIEENLKVREQQALGTSQFLSDEIDRYRAEVREKEEIVFEFRRQYMSEMPEQLASNQSRLAQLQNQLQINNENINSAESRRLQIQQQISELERRVQEQARVAAAGSSGPDLSISEILIKRFAETASAGGPVVDGGKLEALQGEIAKTEEQIRSLLAVYTVKHPEVVRAQADLDRLTASAKEERARLEQERALREEQQRKAEEAARLKAEEESSAAVESSPSEATAAPRYPPVYDQLRMDQVRAEADIARLSAQNEEIQKNIEVYQARIGATPARQLQLQQLSEDYDNLKAVLESLVNKKLQADLSENLERKQKGEQFQILDPANLPEKPFQPQRLRWVGGGLLFGLALGAGSVLLLDLLKQSIKTRRELETCLGVPLLGIIPEIVSGEDIRRRWHLRIWVSGVVTAALLTALSIVHWKMGPLPAALSELASQVRATHWTTLR